MRGRAAARTLARMLVMPALLALAAAAAPAQEQAILLASTTSTQDSGLFAHLLPQFKARTGITVKVVALGTGQALETARRGDVDVVFVHARALEEKFVAEGYGTKRHPVMYNDFVLVGPAADPARIRGLSDAAAALRRICESRAGFVSRGDRSGTHQAELALWQAAGIDIARQRGPWYRAIGQGMGAALNVAAAADAYVLTDRGTWASFRNRGRLAILVEDDHRLRNQYGVILVDPRRHPQVKAALGQRFIDWLIAPDGQAAIAAFRIGGEQLFIPNAHDAGA